MKLDRKVSLDKLLLVSVLVFALTAACLGGLFIREERDYAQLVADRVAEIKDNEWRQSIFNHTSPTSFLPLANELNEISGKLLWSAGVINIQRWTLDEVSLGYTGPDTVNEVTADYVHYTNYNQADLEKFDNSLNCSTDIVSGEYCNELIVWAGAENLIGKYDVYPISYVPADGTYSIPDGRLVLTIRKYDTSTEAETAWTRWVSDENVNVFSEGIGVHLIEQSTYGWYDEIKGIGYIKKPLVAAVYSGEFVITAELDYSILSATISGNSWTHLTSHPYEMVLEFLGSIRTNIEFARYWGWS